MCQVSEKLKNLFLSVGREGGREVGRSRLTLQVSTLPNYDDHGSGSRSSGLGQAQYA